MVAVVSALAISIAKGKTLEELDLLTVIFKQLADTFSTISRQRNIVTGFELLSKSDNAAFPDSAAKDGSL